MMVDGRYIPNSFEFSLVRDLSFAEEIVSNAMAFSEINPATAPIRYQAAEKSARYAAYAALGILSSANMVSDEYRSLVHEDVQTRIDEMRKMQRFEAQLWQEKQAAVQEPAMEVVQQ